MTAAAHLQGRSDAANGKLCRSKASGTLERYACIQGFRVI
jgi:hypothetical protein